MTISPMPITRSSPPIEPGPPCGKCGEDHSTGECTHFAALPDCPRYVNGRWTGGCEVQKYGEFTFWFDGMIDGALLSCVADAPVFVLDNQRGTVMQYRFVRGKFKSCDRSAHVEDAISKAPAGSIFLLYDGVNHYNALISRAQYEFLMRTPFFTINDGDMHRHA